MNLTLLRSPETTQWTHTGPLGEGWGLGRTQQAPVQASGTGPAEASSSVFPGCVPKAPSHTRVHHHVQMLLIPRETGLR